MNRALMVLILVIFLLYIIVCIYRILVYRKINVAFLRFMTSCMLLFTFTSVFYEELLMNKNWVNGECVELASKDESRTFLNSNKYSQDDNYQRDELKVFEKDKKISAYFDNANPPRGALINLIVFGPSGGKVTAICQYKGHGTPYIMDIGKSGQAVIPIKVDSDAEIGVIVVVDILVKYGDITYKTNTVFTPQ